MLFNSYIFILFFLPVSLVLFYWIRSKAGIEHSFLWLVFASLFFYGWWKPDYLILIAVSIIANYLLGQKISSVNHRKKLWLSIGVGLNLFWLGYFKYANFFVENTNLLLATQWHLEEIILPLAISFFTFQQVAFLVDAYQGKTKEYSFLHYCLFVTFFPQLIAGPIVHHKEMMPQFMKPDGNHLIAQNLAIGMTIFTLGLFKKVIVADNLALYASPVFRAADMGVEITFLEAWVAGLAYTFQLYFDFSGYSDMALGLARMFGVRLPLNFFSPLKARNISDFWRRWHMTLSRFLRDYLYIPLGGNRNGELKRYRNLLTTMLLGGIWHGAGWSFMIWGALHGMMLALYHLWDDHLCPAWYKKHKNKLTIPAVMTTFLFVMFAFVIFRAQTLSGAWSILTAMFGSNGIALHPDAGAWVSGLTKMGFNVEVSTFASRYIDKDVINWLVFAGALAWLFPNTVQLMKQWHIAYDQDSMVNKYPSKLAWSPNWKWLTFTSVLLLLSLINLNSVSEFLYFQF
ncbi:MAG: MBOAT family protein [gamma proteobacterium symbiont of Bathyaustriella thionipta]|nr:MBOAT family protein [gamma proteobacterium symbiont of Bathyaustriella thionipta]MCU7948674.1 MBOAT family protein [gamma proteobacterium symbiont of Bathyaustriella thionipta]MCU7952620.1 MBOAT family protein [gamma proteobacterium symbiont of Bathyaustriella thionipta]MCU7955117.1 MBOAT family protein [gamma proteobacterium symbiont of Bathyaustriella thionipta]MCU7968268.1 MBOAT family protein [gamma proteobacterium symbiont of Bathyaustriella thionipta]